MLTVTRRVDAVFEGVVAVSRVWKGWEDGERGRRGCGLEMGMGEGGSRCARKGEKTTRTGKEARNGEYHRSNPPRFVLYPFSACNVVTPITLSSHYRDTL